MPIVEYLIVAGGAFAAGLALGPILNQRSRQLIAVGGAFAVLAGAALMWPTSRSILSETLAFDLFGLSSLGLEFSITLLYGIGAVLLPLTFGASITGN
jgi:hypothetical protein